ncbi:hypothetical protein ACFL27_13625 [candidate division CSSED10-310 bacterium]|uniref:Uncharacterized protein n=1 Tax=candidate division CSSED10-310 bacterium TaxID=2855610 RepID=A0ABV6YYG4_UNCC1
MNAFQIEARRWFSQSQAELAVVRTLRAAQHDATSCFFAQQTNEPQTNK